MNSLSANYPTNDTQHLWFFPGAQRVGTHFQINTIVEALTQKNIPFVHHPGIELDAHNPEKFLENMILLQSLPERYILVNGHWRTRKERDFLLSYENALCFLIWRDFRDALVSYYHFLIKRRQRTFRDFAHFYWTEGYLFLWRQSTHQQTWYEIGEHPRVFHADFMRLKTDFSGEAGRMLAFAGLVDVDLPMLEKEVSIERRQIKEADEKGDFYRKGDAGEYWEVVKDKEILSHVEQVLRWGKVENRISRMIYYKYLIWSCNHRPKYKFALP